MEDYAKALHSLGCRRDVPVGTSAVAQHLGVAAASASVMLKRLAELGLVERVPYRGVRLTASGEALATAVLRHHRLVELYLVDVLGMPSEDVHDEAEVLEHYISAELERCIVAKLGQPGRDLAGAVLESDTGGATHGRHQQSV